MSDIATAIVVGNLTRDPESIADGRGCTFALAVNQRIKKGEEWQDYASFFDVTVWGKTAEACVKYLGKGSKAAVEAELRQERWEKDGNKRSAVKLHARNVQFLTFKDDNGSGGGGRQQADVPADTGDFAASSSAAADDDIPF